MAAEWYFANQGQQRGPISFEELQERARSGRLQPTDLVWSAPMADWVPASAQPGLFAKAQAAPPAVTPRRDGPSYDRPADDEFRPQRPAGMGTGAKIALFGCGGLTIVMALCCGVVGIIGVIANNNSNERTWDLPIGGVHHWTLPFKKGDKVEITVESTGQSDVDLFVFQNKANYEAFLKAENLEKVAAGLCVAYDNSPSSDCRVEFTAPVTGDYWVLVANRKSMDQPQRNAHNSGKLLFQPSPQ